MGTVLLFTPSAMTSLCRKLSPESQGHTGIPVPLITHDVTIKKLVKDNVGKSYCREILTKARTS